MTFNILTLLSILLIQEVIAEDFTKPGSPGKPLSMFETGFHATQIYLERSELAEGGKSGVRGHFVANFKIQDKEYSMQVTSFSSVSGLVGTFCEKCDSDKPFVTDGQTFRGST